MRPTQKWFVIKRPNTNSFYSIWVDASDGGQRKAMVAFRSKDQARTYTRLMHEMERERGPKKIKMRRHYVTEDIDMRLLTRLCDMSGLDVIVYGHGGEYEVIEAMQEVSEDIKFDFENRYRWGGA